MPAFEAHDPALGAAADERARLAEGAAASEDGLLQESPPSEPPREVPSSPVRGILIALIPAALLWWAIFAGLRALLHLKH